MNRFIRLLSLLSLDGYVSDNRAKNVTCAKTDTGTSESNRKDTIRAIRKGLEGCSKQQEFNRRRKSSSMQSIFRQLAEEAKARICKESKRVKKSKGRVKESRKAKIANNRLIFPSFLFSYQFFIVLQSIDDICFQINPILVSELSRWH